MKWPAAFVIAAAMLSGAIAWSSRTVEAGAFGSGKYMIINSGVGRGIWHLNTDNGELRICDWKDGSGFGTICFKSWKP
jgi:hypothetical protein